MLDLSGFTERLGFGSSEDDADIDEYEVITTDEHKIEFVCEKEFYDVIPKPQPANKVLPDWYKQLDGKIGDGLGESTVKRCAPFLDALSAGWIIPLAGEVELRKEGTDLEINWNLHRDLVGRHEIEQVGGNDFPINRPILKFNNYWAIKVPKGYSVLFTDPLNRVEDRFNVFSGMVDCDRYFNYINFPFMYMDDSDGTTLIDAGTPLVQAIPIKRDTLISDGSTHVFEDDEMLAFNRTKLRLDVEESDYRNNRWVLKDGTRIVEE